MADHSPHEFGRHKMKLLGCPLGRKWMDQKRTDQWVISPTYTWGIPWGYNLFSNHLVDFYGKSR